MPRKRPNRTFELRKDATIAPPAARLTPAALAPQGLDPPWQELYQDAEREISTLKKEKRELADFSTGICAIALALTKMLIDDDHAAATGDTVTIPRFVHESTLGAGLTLGEDRDGNPTVQVRERGRPRIAPVQ